MGPSFRRGRRRGLVVGAAIGSSRAKRAGAAQPAAAQPAAAPAGQDQINLLKQLAELRDQGILTNEEFEAKKKQLLGL
ncbi:MAG: SHOCT domain-containing protein [Candidatus Saccharimonadales bacterium]